jgi:nucleoside-diphosphate-sugar epimerase
MSSQPNQEHEKIVLVTGANGFIAGYLVEELLNSGYRVIGLDNFSKYGRVQKSYDSNPNYKLVEGDAKDTELILHLLDGCQHLVAGAALIGGISYFHEFAYDLMAENERITASTFDAAIQAHKHKALQKITVLSSSMVFESCEIYPTAEGMQKTSPPPLSTYGFQKLATTGM